MRNKRKLASVQYKEQEGLCLQIKSSKHEEETPFTTLNTCNKILNMRQKCTGNSIRMGVDLWAQKQ